MVNSMDNGIGCVILAAGRSSRLGKPKALIEVEGVSLISWILSRLSKVGMTPIVVTREELVEGIRDSVGDIEIIVNEEPELGRTGSVKKGLKHLKQKNEAYLRILIVPVDRPGFSISTVKLLISMKSSSCPSSGGRGGHPVIVDNDDIEKILEAPSNSPLNSIIKPDKIDVEDKFLHINLDTQEDVDGFLRVVGSL